MEDKRQSPSKAPKASNPMSFHSDGEDKDRPAKPAKARAQALEGPEEDPECDIVIFYSTGNDVSSIREDSQYLIEDFQDRTESAQLLSHLASAGRAFDNKLLLDDECKPLCGENQESLDHLSTTPYREFKHKRSPLEAPLPSGTTRFLQLLPQLLFFGLLVAAFLVCVFDYKWVMRLFNEFILWVQHHPYQSIGYSFYLVCFSIILTLPISYTIVMLGYSYTKVFSSQSFGFLFSVPIVFLGCLVGGLIAFLLSRYLFKDFIKEQIQQFPTLNKNFKIIDEILETEGKLITALLRLSYMPFGVTSYIMGVSSISFWDYLLGNLSYILMTCLQISLGCSLFSVADSTPGGEKTKKALMVAEIACSIIVTIVIGYVSKSILEKKMKEREEKIMNLEQTETEGQYLSTQPNYLRAAAF